MIAIFGMFTQNLHVHMKIYRNLTKNLTKGKKIVQKGPKRRENDRYLEKYNITP